MNLDRGFLISFVAGRKLKERLNRRGDVLRPTVEMHEGILSFDKLQGRKTIRFLKSIAEIPQQ